MPLPAGLLRKLSLLLLATAFTSLLLPGAHSTGEIPLENVSPTVNSDLYQYSYISLEFNATDKAIDPAWHHINMTAATMEGDWTAIDTTIDLNTTTGLINITGRVSGDTPAGPVGIFINITNRTSGAVLHTWLANYSLNRNITPILSAPHYISAGDEVDLEIYSRLDNGILYNASGYVLWQGANLTISRATDMLLALQCADNATIGIHEIVVHLDGDAYNRSYTGSTWVVIREKAVFEHIVIPATLSVGGTLVISGYVNETESGYILPYAADPSDMMPANNTTDEFPWTRLDHLNNINTYHKINITVVNSTQPSILPTLYIEADGWLDSNGRFEVLLDISYASANTHRITLEFPPIYYFDRSTVNLTFQMMQTTIITANTSAISGTPGMDIVIDGRLWAMNGLYHGFPEFQGAYVLSDGTITHGMPVEIYVNGVRTGNDAVTASGGWFSAIVPIPALSGDNANITLRFGGDTSHGVSSMSFLAPVRTGATLEIYATENSNSITVQGWLNRSGGIKDKEGIPGAIIEVRWGGEAGTLISPAIDILTDANGHFTIDHSVIYQVAEPVEAYARYYGSTYFEGVEDTAWLFLTDTPMIRSMEFEGTQPDRATSGKINILRGTVTNSRGEGIEGITVKAYRSGDNKMLGSAESGSGGVWRMNLTIVASGPATLIITTEPTLYYVYGDADGSFSYAFEDMGSIFNGHGFTGNRYRYLDTSAEMDITVWQSLEIRIISDESYTPGYTVFEGVVLGATDKLLVSVLNHKSIYSTMTTATGAFSVEMLLSPDRLGTIPLNFTVIEDIDGYVYSEKTIHEITVRSPTNITIKKQSPISDSTLLSLSLRDMSGRGVGGAIIILKYEGGNLSGITDNNGTALYHLSTNRSLGSIGCTAIYAGNKSYLPVEFEFEVPVDLTISRFTTDILPFIMAITLPPILAVYFGLRVTADAPVQVRRLIRKSVWKMMVKNEYSQVILELYSRLIVIFRAHGLMRDDSQTFGEFSEAAGHVLKGCAPSDVEKMLSIIEEIIYSKHNISKSHRGEAIVAFNRIVSSLRTTSDAKVLATDTDDMEEEEEKVPKMRPADEEEKGRN